MILELFNCILANKANTTGIKAAVAEIQNQKTISKEKKKDELTQDVTNSKENFDPNNLLIDWLDSFPASP